LQIESTYGEGRVNECAAPSDWARIKLTVPSKEHPRSTESPSREPLTLRFASRHDEGASGRQCSLINHVIVSRTWRSYSPIPHRLMSKAFAGRRTRRRCMSIADQANHPRVLPSHGRQLCVQQLYRVLAAPPRPGIAAQAHLPRPASPPLPQCRDQLQRRPLLPGHSLLLLRRMTATSNRNTSVSPYATPASACKVPLDSDGGSGGHRRRPTSD
jgi:hypothetical protein